MFCEKCGNKVKENDKFCSVCGNALNLSEDVTETKQTSPNGIISTINSIGYVLVLIGTVAGIGSISYIIECESAHTDMTNAGWNYHYNGGQELAITIAVFAVTAFLIGICMASSKKN